MPAGRVVLVHRISSISLELNILAAGASTPCTPPHSEEDFNMAGWRLLWWSMVTAKLRSCLDRNVFRTVRRNVLRITRVPSDRCRAASQGLTTHFLLSRLKHSLPPICRITRSPTRQMHIRLSRLDHSHPPIFRIIRIPTRQMQIRL